MKKYLKYILLFLGFLIWNIIFNPLSIDEVWNYGFSYNIAQGLIPYKDFNMVITPFYPFFNSLFLILNSNFSTFHIINALILTITSYFLFKMYDKKALLIICWFFTPFAIGQPNYSLFSLFLFILLIYCNRYKKNDYLLGFIVGLSILTKQNIGVCLSIPLIIEVLKNKKSLIKRLLGMSIPLIVFLIYLLFNNCLYQFFDLCLFGLFDFTKSNTSHLNIIYLFMFILLLFSYKYIKKDKLDNENYYLLGFYVMILPIFNAYHFMICLMAFFVVYFKHIHNIPLNINLFFILFVIVNGIYTFHVYNNKITDFKYYPNNIKHFEYRFIKEDNIKNTKIINKFIKNNKNKKLVFLVSNAYFFRIINDEKISYLDLINDGNSGYNGSQKIIKKIKNCKNCIFIIDRNESTSSSQTDKLVIKYVIKNYKKTRNISNYEVYEN